MSTTFCQAIEKRRSYYSIGNEEIVEEKKLTDIICHSINHCPSSFNSQSSRVVLLLGRHHIKLWEIVKDEIKKILPAEAFESSQNKIDNCFLSGYGTVLFFEDTNTVKELQEKFPLYKENFPVWSNQSSGMLQYAIWTALELEGLGASLQHYNPLIDGAVKQEWDIPAEYKLIAQMPFGKPLAPPDLKDFLPIETRFQIFK